MKQNELSHILVVEDDTDDLFLLTHQLEKAKIKDHVTFMGNGKEALNYLLQAPFPPIVIFLDLHLPGLSGVELLHRIRQDSRLKTVPVIVMTGFNDPHDIKQCHALGITAFLTKPLDISTFTSAVANLFQNEPIPG